MSASTTRSTVTDHSYDRLIIDDPHLPPPLLDPGVDLSGILATRAVLADFDEQFCDGSGDPSMRAALVAKLVDEVLPLACCSSEQDTVRMTPRPGVLYRSEWASDVVAATPLTQLQTDGAIRSEVWAMVSSRLTRDTIRNAAAALSVGTREYESMQELARPFGATVIHQRGGIDSDPLVRLLAYRAWGDRDQRWHDMRRPRGDFEIDRIGDIVGNASGMTPRYSSTPYREGDVLRAAGEEYKVVSVGHTAMSREGMVRSSTRRERRPPPVPKWAKPKKGRAARSGR